MVRALRITGWALVAAGVLVALYLVYTLFFTNFTTSRAQDEMAEQWQSRTTSEDEPGHDTEVEEERLAAQAEAERQQARGAAVDDGAVAMLEFDRPGSDEPIVRADPLFVVGDVDLPTLRKGPGHYPSTGSPGEEGNFAVAGHRTTYGAPFLHLDQLRAGDEIRVTDRDGRRHTYEVADTRVVGPNDRWVLDPDPLGTGEPMLTLTTCHPRFSAAKRLVVFAEMAG